MRSALLMLACTGCAAAAGEKIAWSPTSASAASSEEAASGWIPAPAASTARRSDDSRGRGGSALDRSEGGGEREPALLLPQSPADLGASLRTLTFAWPLAASGINSLFGQRSDPFDGKPRFHAGIDLDAPYGMVVGAAASGVVLHAGWTLGHGRQVVIAHAGGFRTVYSHLAQVLVFAGAMVRTGDAVGRVGSSGRSTGPHLHFELSRWERPLDPLDLLGDSVTLTE